VLAQLDDKRQRRGNKDDRENEGESSSNSHEMRSGQNNSIAKGPAAAMGNSQPQIRAQIAGLCLQSLVAALIPMLHPLFPL